MRIHVCDQVSQVAQAAAAIVAAQIIEKPDSVLGLATGSTPLPAYKELIRLHQGGILDFSRVVTFNLDEYCRLPVDHECSYRSFMQREFFSHINIPPGQTHLPDGNAGDLRAEAEAYDAAIAEAGGIDLQVLGIGRNGHIGFNEPASRFVYHTHVTSLSPSTIGANRRFFAGEADVPRQAVTMGIGGIMRAKRILLIATGEDKAEAVGKAVRGDVSPELPASILRVHSRAVMILDKAAAGSL